MTDRHGNPASGGHEDDRYSRQARFPGVGREGQQRLRSSHVLVVGCGALGSAAVDLLARSGVGRITVVDRDFVELSNLQRQLLFDEADAAAGTPKAVAAAAAVRRVNSDVVVEAVVADLTPDNVSALVDAADVVVDGTDNLETRYLINDACVKAHVPWIYGGAVGSTGMSMVVVPGETACFRCLFPVPAPAGSLATCESAGVLASTVVMVSAFQWTEAVKLLVGARDRLNLDLVYFDVWENERVDSARAGRSAQCPCCAQGRFEFLEADLTSRTASLCGRNAVQVSPGRSVRLDLNELAGRLDGLGRVTTTAFLLRLGIDGYELTVFPDGRAIVKGTDEISVARSLYARYVGA